MNRRLFVPLPAPLTEPHSGDQGAARVLRLATSVRRCRAPAALLAALVVLWQNIYGSSSDTLLFNPPQCSAAKISLYTQSSPEEIENLQLKRLEAVDPQVRMLWQYYDDAYRSGDYANAASMAHKLIPLDKTRPWELLADYAAYRDHRDNLSLFLDSVKRTKSSAWAKTVAYGIKVLPSAENTTIVSAIVRQSNQLSNNLGTILFLAAFAEIDGDINAAIDLRRRLTKCGGDIVNQRELCNLVERTRDWAALDADLAQLSDIDPDERIYIEMRRLEAATQSGNQGNVGILKQKIELLLARSADYASDSSSARMQYAAILARRGEIEPAKWQYAAVANSDVVAIITREDATIQCLNLQTDISAVDRQLLENLSANAALPSLRDEAARIILCKAKPKSENRN